MGIVTKIKDANFTNYTDAIEVPAFPTVENLKIRLKFGGNLALSAKNRAGSGAATVVGSPTISANSAIVNNLKGFAVATPATTNDRTYIAISKSAANTILCGHATYDLTSSNNCALSMTSSRTGMIEQSLVYARAPAATGVGATVRFFAATLSGMTAKTFQGTSGALVITSETVAAAQVNGKNFSCGAFNTLGTTFPTDVETYEVLYFDRALSELELNDLYTHYKTAYQHVAID